MQVYPQVVDQRLPEPCPQNPEPFLRLLLWSRSSNADRASLQGYAGSLSKILAADLIEVDFPWRGLKSIAELSRAAEQVHPDLIITQIRRSSQLIDKFFCCSTQKQVNQLPAIMIVPDKPSWPLTNLMMALPNSNTEYECAIRWTSLLAHSSQSQVTVIPFLPPVPVFFGSYMNHRIQALLTAGDPLGSVMRSIAQKFSEENVDWVFKLQDGEPQDQLCEELAASDPDLVIFHPSIPAPRRILIRRSGLPAAAKAGPSNIDHSK